VRAARFELTSGSMEARQAQMEAMQAEMQRTCPSKRNPRNRADPPYLNTIR
jgi:hypothetical protein